MDHNFKPGWKGRISGYREQSIAQHLLSLGLSIGKTIEIVGRSPFGQTYRVQLEHRSIALRLKELNSIEFNSEK